MYIETLTFVKTLVKGTASYLAKKGAKSLNRKLFGESSNETKQDDEIQEEKMEEMDYIINLIHATFFKYFFYI
jgi:hypothetical protein